MVQNGDEIIYFSRQPDENAVNKKLIKLFSYNNPLPPEELLITGFSVTCSTMTCIAQLLYITLTIKASQWHKCMMTISYHEKAGLIMERQSCANNATNLNFAWINMFMGSSVIALYYLYITHNGCAIMVQLTS